VAILAWLASGLPDLQRHLRAHKTVLRHRAAPLRRP
jgi:hypothetical protein